MITNPTPTLPLLLVDDDAVILKASCRTLQNAGFDHIVTLQDSREVLSFLSAHDVEMMVLDLSMPHLSGEEILPQIVRDFPEIPVIVMTGSSDLDTAVRCLKAGAMDYIVKPVESARFVAGVRQALDNRELKREVKSLRDSLLSRAVRNPDAFREIITEDEGMRSVFQYLEMVASTTRPLMITGETGVGKEMVARAVHTLSKRKGKFVSVNVAGLDDTLFSDTLFGHEKGAFTGADRKRAGLIEQAAGGTLFLDEIGDMEMATQIKMLRLLQEGEYYPLGSDIPRKTDARVLVATHRDLQSHQHASQFRRDLYYRLSTHHVHIPPLRERKGDLSLLVESFLTEASKSLGKKKPSAPPTLIALLSNYNFPGNIRELESMIFDAVTRYTRGVLSTQSFREIVLDQQEGGEAALGGNPPVPTGNAKVFNWHEIESLPTVKHAEQSLIQEAMKRAGGNQALAAELLGLSPSALNRRLKKTPS